MGAGTAAGNRTAIRMANAGVNGPGTNRRSWLHDASRTTAILAASLFAFVLLIERNLESAVAIALVGASVGGALGTLDYRLGRSIPAWSRRGLGLWACSAGWGLPLLFVAFHLGPFRTPEPDWLANLGLALPCAAGLAVVSLVPLSWLQGQWGQRPPSA